MSQINENQKNVNQIEDANNLEKLFAELDQVVSKLESYEISLEDSFKLYQKGMGLLKECNDKIDRVEKQILILDEGGETNEL